MELEQLRPNCESRHGARYVIVHSGPRRFYALQFVFLLEVVQIYCINIYSLENYWFLYRKLSQALFE